MMPAARDERRALPGLALRLSALLLLSCGEAASVPQGGQSGGATGLEVSFEAPLAPCGQVGEACCSAPLLACDSDLVCDAGACAPSPTATRPWLCRSDRDCSAGQHCCCCSSGALGECIALAPGAECPLPDLIVTHADTELYVDSVDVGANACSVWCRDFQGSRRVLRLGPLVYNVGDADLIAGSAGDAHVRRDACGVSYLDDMLLYELLDANRVPVRQRYVPFSPGCVPEGSGGPRFGCDLLGVSQGVFFEAASFDGVYDAAGLPADNCQGLDISGLPLGLYTLRLTVNPNGLLREKSLDNNSWEAPATFLPLAPCEGAVFEEEGEHECGWTQGPVQTCTPKQRVFVGCGDCTPDSVDLPLLRICEGTAQCVNGLNGRGTFGGCPRAQFRCPDSGAYSALWAPQDYATASVPCQPVRYDPSLLDPTASCDLQPVFEGTADPARECGWAIGAAAPCVPGASVALGCPGCEGAPLIRVCAGSEPCTLESERGMRLEASSGVLPGGCPSATFVCPEGGSYTALVTSEPAAFFEQVSCNLRELGQADAGASP